MNHLILLICIAGQAGTLPAIRGTTPGQQEQSQAKRQGGQIAGYVVTDVGQPMVRVTIARVGKSSALPLSNRTTTTDERGGFQFSNIQPGNYTVSVRAPGYVRADDSSEHRYYRPGDSVVLTLFKGGAITGSVRNHLGEALINVPVRAFRIRDMEGKPAGVSASVAYRLTDDRGVYRLYGLAPGAYLVCAGGGYRSYAGFNKYENDAPTYHPSSSFQTAEKVIVQPGQEVSGIDITYRGEEGHVVSGTTAVTNASRAGSSVGVALTNRSTGEVRYFGYTMQDGSFAFYGVPDGEYDLIAQSFPGDEKEKAVSQPYRIKVAGADVTGIRLGLSPLGTISGRMVLEPLPKDSSRKCEQKQRVLVEEAIVSLQRERTRSDPERLWDTSNVYGSPDEKGFFSIYGISAGQYRINATVPGETWFTKSVAIMKEPAGSRKGGTNSGQTDSVLNSIPVRLGTQLQLSVTLAEGAARLKGRVSPPEEKSLPPGISVHLVPAEPKYFENALRFSRTEVQNDGVFSFSNIAPGKYWIFTQTSDGKSNDNSPSDPSPWNTGGRTMLRREARKSNITIELYPCQSVQDYIVKFKPGS